MPTSKGWRIMVETMIVVGYPRAHTLNTCCQKGNKISMVDKQSDNFTLSLLHSHLDLRCA